METITIDELKELSEKVKNGIANDEEIEKYLYVVNGLSEEFIEVLKSDKIKQDNLK